MMQHQFNDVFDNLFDFYMKLDNSCNLSAVTLQKHAFKVGDVAMSRFLLAVTHDSNTLRLRRRLLFGAHLHGPKDAAGGQLA